MSPPSLSKKLSRSLKVGTLALGFGGLLAADTPAHKSGFQAGAGPTPYRDLALDAVVMFLNGEKIYFSQRGGAFEELSLGSTQQATYLRQLLKDAGAAEHPVSVPIGSMVVANGGGAGDGKRPVAEETKPKELEAGTASEKKEQEKKTKQAPSNPAIGK
jgi:hypothetical protein